MSLKMTFTPLDSPPLLKVWSTLSFFFFVSPLYREDITWQISIVLAQILGVISLVKGKIQRLVPSKLQEVTSVSVQPSLTANRVSSEPPTLPGPSTSHPWHLELSQFSSQMRTFELSMLFFLCCFEALWRRQADWRIPMVSGWIKMVFFVFFHLEVPHV